MNPDQLVSAIRAKLDEMEEKANAATPGPWTAREGTDGWSIDPDVAWPGYDVRSGVDNRADAEHMALHDPSSVLRRVAAGRRVFERHQPVSVFGANYCTHCGIAVMGQSASSRAHWPCAEIRDLADGLGIDITEETLHAAG